MEAQGPSAADLLGRFRDDLQTLLRQVCPILGTLRALSESAAHDRIYQLYSGPTTANRYDPARDRDFLQKFLRILLGLRRECGKTVAIQGYGGTLSLEDLIQYYEGAATGANFLPACTMLCKERKLRVPTTVQGMVALLEIDLWSNFYHFLSAKFGTMRITRRVYIHCSSCPNSLRVLRACLEILDHPMCEGLMEIKIAGPGCGGRLDTIVAYLSDDGAVDRFLKAMLMQNIPANCFAAGVPKGIQEKSTGIGIADEPPDIALLEPISFEGIAEEDHLQNQEAQSFGGFLAGLIVIALQDTHSDVEFLANLVNLFHIAGIDPANPHIHAGRQQLEALNKQTLAAKWKRKSQ